MAKMHFLARAEIADGYPLMEFEDWYQQGLSCFYAQLPQSLRRQAMHALLKRWMEKGKKVSFWMLRTFAYGAAGRGFSGQHTPRVSKDYRWPDPPDAAWELVVCCYPDGMCDLDIVHPVSRRFWTEDNDFFDPPGGNGDRYFTRNWYEQMGFDVIVMHPETVVMEGSFTRHLSVV